MVDELSDSAAEDIANGVLATSNLMVSALRMAAFTIANRHGPEAAVDFSLTALSHTVGQWFAASAVGVGAPLATVLAFVNDAMPLFQKQVLETIEARMKDHHASAN